jgi:transposase
MPAKETAIMARKKYYSVEFQDEACKLVTHQGYTQQKAADKLGVTRVTIQNWMKKRDLITPVEMVEPDFSSSQDPALLQARIKDLEKRLARSETEREILKKATAYFANQSP